MPIPLPRPRHAPLDIAIVRRPPDHAGEQFVPARPAQAGLVGRWEEEEGLRALGFPDCGGVVEGEGVGWVGGEAGFLRRREVREGGC